MKIVINDKLVKIPADAIVTIFPETRAEYDAMSTCAATYNSFSYKNDGIDEAWGLTTDRCEKLDDWQSVVDAQAQIAGRTPNDVIAEKAQRRDPTFMIAKRSELYSTSISCAPEDDSDEPHSTVRLFTALENKDFLKGLVNLAINQAQSMDQKQSDLIDVLVGQVSKLQGVLQRTWSYLEHIANVTGYGNGQENAAMEYEDYEHRVHKVLEETK